MPFLQLIERKTRKICIHDLHMYSILKYHMSISHAVFPNLTINEGHPQEIRRYFIQHICTQISNRLYSIS
jgi:hypothetical protein